MNDIVLALVLCVGVPMVFCVAIPFIIMAALAPSLNANAPKSPNFRGVLVYNGLGIVWFIWLLSFWIGAQAIDMLHFEQPAWVTYVARLFPLIAGACAFGLFDDWAGCNNTKGFSGHLRALFRGRLTTGGLKFIGIGFLSLFLSISLFYHGADTIPVVILSTCTIALMANLMNLFDLRPGRAQKMYLLSLVFALAIIVLFGMVNVIGWWSFLAIAIVALGPFLATWRYDIRELGMLGDAGANSMGAFIGFLIATALSTCTWALAVVVVFLAVINILSEKVSFSKIIAGNRALSCLDALGRKRIGNEDMDVLGQNKGLSEDILHKKNKEADNRTDDIGVEK